jgi:Flp pilus assembly protein TadG
MKKIKTERGQSLVEFGVSLVVLLYLLSGAVEFGILFFQFVQLRDAAQEGALYGSINPSDIPGITDRIQYSSSSPLDLPTEVSSGGVIITISIDGVASTDANYANVDCEGHGLKVEVSYIHRMFMPFLSGREIPLNATVTDTILSPYVC